MEKLLAKHNLIFYAQNAKRCGAKTRKGTYCLAPAMTNGRCRLHGGLSPGAPSGEKNGNYKHGLYTQKTKEKMKEIKELQQKYENHIGKSEEFLDEIMNKINQTIEKI